MPERPGPRQAGPSVAPRRPPIGRAPPTSRPRPRLPEDPGWPASPGPAPCPPAAAPTLEGADRGRGGSPFRDPRAAAAPTRARVRGRPHGTCSGAPLPSVRVRVPQRRAAVELRSSWVPADADVGFVGGPAGLGARRLFCWFRSENVRAPALCPGFSLAVRWNPRTSEALTVTCASGGSGRSVRPLGPRCGAGPLPQPLRTAADRRPSARRAPTWASKFCLCRAPGECRAFRTRCRACPGRRCCGTAPRREGWAAGRPGAARVLAQSDGGLAETRLRRERGTWGAGQCGRTSRVLTSRGPVGLKRASAVTGRNSRIPALRGSWLHRKGEP